MNVPLVLVATFLASCVEAVEAVAIVVGVGEIRGWRSTWLGTAAALALLAVVVGVFGAALGSVPIGPLRLAVGFLLLVFGLGWLRKGIRRVAVRGLAGDRFEDEVPDGGTPAGVDWTAFVLAFKGVFLEGVEVAFIVVSFGATAHQLGGAALAGLAAAVVTAGVGLAIHPALRRVPRSALILVVGLMLASFGTFWAVEGLGIEWPLADGSIPLLLVVYAGTAAILLEGERRATRRRPLVQA